MAQINWGEDLQNFFNHDIGNMFKNMFKFPTTCIKRIQEESKVKSLVTPICALLISFIFCTLFALMLELDFGDAVLVGLIPVFYMVFLAILLFVMMAVKGKPDIMTALSHTSVHGLNYTVVMLLFSLLSLMDTSKFLVIIMALVLVYGMSMGISNIRQSLGILDEENKEAFTWWISPAVVLLSLYLAFLIFGKTFDPMSLLFY